MDAIASDFPNGFVWNDGATYLTHSNFAVTQEVDNDDVDLDTAQV